MQKVNSYKIPSSGEARENLRKKGQFWTPDWVAEAMVDYVFANKGGVLFDPAVGAGAFFRAAKVIAHEKIYRIHFQEWILIQMRWMKQFNTDRSKKI